MYFHRSYFCSINVAVLKVIFVFFLVFPYSSISADEFPLLQSHFINVSRSQNTISANLVGADISDVAETLSKAGIKVLLDESISHKITSKIQNMPLEAGIKRLLGPALSSAFIFTKEKNPNGKLQFCLNTVKIFKSGNMMSASFMDYNKGIPGESGKHGRAGASSSADSAPVVNSKQQHPGSSKKHIPRTQGAIKYEIMLARQNLDLLRQKNRFEISRANRKIAELKMKLSRTFSHERAGIVRELGRAEQELVKVKSSDSIIIEEMNIRRLTDGLSKIDDQKKLADRQRKAEKLRDVRKQRFRY